MFFVRFLQSVGKVFTYLDGSARRKGRKSGGAQDTDRGPRENRSRSRRHLNRARTWFSDGCTTTGYSSGGHNGGHQQRQSAYQVR